LDLGSVPEDQGPRMYADPIHTLTHTLEIVGVGILVVLICCGVVALQNKLRQNLHDKTK